MKAIYIDDVMNGFGEKYNLTIGKEYDILSDNDGFVDVVDDKGERQKNLFKSRFAIINGDKSMKKIKIRKWEDLVGMHSEDKWGNKTEVYNIYGITIMLKSYRKAYKSENRSIYLDENVDGLSISGIKGGRERVLEELKMCGFDVEFIKKPVLTDEQKLELRYLKKLHKRKWLTRNDGSEKPRSWNNKPTKQTWCWGFGENSETKLNYDFISWEDDEPWSIEELLEN
ncbi:MAG TPA: hypothetical protein GXZ90_00370 [Clostridiales bacterium]|nr:hypothetical protein [Clostridiales bacterium]